MSERRACKVIGFSRSSFKYSAVEDPFSKEVEKRVINLATMYGRYGYKKITELLHNQGFKVGRNKVFRIWQREGLKVPQKQPKRARLWLGDGSCIRKRPEYKNHVWSYDFVSHITERGTRFKILNIIDEYTRECLFSHVARRIRSKDVLHILADLFVARGTPTYIRSDNVLTAMSNSFLSKNLSTAPFGTKNIF